MVEEPGLRQPDSHSKVKGATPPFERMAPPGFHRDDTRVHELIWPDYESVRAGLNHIAVLENDVSASKIPHGTRCKIYITNALNDYAKRQGYHKRGSYKRSIRFAESLESRRGNDLDLRILGLVSSHTYQIFYLT